MISAKAIGTVTVLALTLVSLAALSQVRQTPVVGDAAAKVVDVRGNLRVPENYRTLYQALGTWAVSSGSGEGTKEIHQVYASPGAIDAYRATGAFPDGTVLVKEVFGAATQPMTTGLVSHAQELKGWFVMVRDTGNSRAGNRLWGDGWGWSWFDADNPLKTTSADYKSDCLTCHLPAKATNWIYAGGYPALRR